MDWPLYDGHHVVFRPRRMTAEKLIKETMAGMLRVYDIRRLPRMLAKGELKRIAAHAPRLQIAPPPLPVLRLQQPVAEI
jgi:hypothetical protein